MWFDVTKPGLQSYQCSRTKPVFSGVMVHTHLTGPGQGQRLGWDSEQWVSIL